MVITEWLEPGGSVKSAESIGRFVPTAHPPKAGAPRPAPNIPQQPRWLGYR